MPKKKEVEQTEAWTCPFCQQTIRSNGLPTSDDFGDRCLFPEHIVNDVCLAMRDPQKARELLLDID
jgi:hypothetical protein